MTDTRFSHYRILGPLGSGGMGEVHRARDESLKRDVALKVLRAGPADDPSARARLLREARTASSLNHPHICTIYEVGEAGGEMYIAMELIPGAPLSQLIPHGGMPEESVTRLGAEIADALSHAHERGVIHRDVKTSNVMLTPEGRAKVLDFGLAKRLPSPARSLDPSTLTPTDSIVGTPASMAPEVLRGEPATERSDIWALGLVLYEMATGEAPFQGQTVYETADAILNREPQPLPTRVSAGLRAVIGQCLAKEPGRRFQRASEVRAALTALRSSSGVTPPPRPLRAARRRLWVAAAAIAVLAGGIAWALLGHRSISSRTILIMPLKVLGQPQGAEYVGLAFAQALAVDLAQAAELKVLPVPESVRDVTHDRAMRLARVAGAGRVVVGELIREGERLRASIEMLDVAENRIVWGSAGNTERTDLTGMAGELADNAARSLQVSLGKSYDFPLYLAGSPDMASSPEAIACLEAMRQGRSTRALASAGELVARFPLEPGAHALRAYVASMAWGAHRDSLAFRAALEDELRILDQIDPGNPYGGMFRGVLALSDGRIDDADREFATLRGMTGLRPGCRAWILRASAAFAIVKVMGGADAPDLSAPRGPKPPEIPATAIADLQESVRLDPTNAWGYERLSELLQSTWRSEEALPNAQRAEALQPSSPLTHLNSGHILAALGRWEESIPHYAAACSLAVANDPTSQNEFLAFLAIARQKAGDARAAAADARRAEALPATPAASYQLARYHALIGDRRGAIAQLRVSVGLGFRGTRISREPEFAPLRSDPEFQAIVAGLGTKSGGG